MLENYFKQSLGFIANWSFYSFNPYTNYNENEKENIKALKKLSKNDNLVITRPDKCTEVVLLEKTAYKEKIETILPHSTKFSRVTTDHFSHIKT